MGKKRIKVIGDTTKAKKGLPAGRAGSPRTVGERKLVKTGKEHGRITDVGAEMLAEAKMVEKKAKKLEAEVKKAAKKVEKPKKPKKKKSRGKRYQAALKKIDRTKSYPPKEAVKLLKDISISQFNGSVDVHLVLKEKGLKGEVKFPHPTGKKYVVRVADKKLIEELEAGKINFNLLVASPEMMPKLVKFAKVLGPRGLMPNPKAGTISQEPEKLAKKLAGQSNRQAFKTETKAPLIHLSIGKLDMPEKKLKENFIALIQAVGEKNINKAVLTPTMGPGVKVYLGSIS